MKTEQELKVEGDNYHELYTREGAGSPEYQYIIRCHGRDLRPAIVRMVMEAHSIPLAELLDDEHDPILPEPGKLPETLDAALLYAWLGY